MKTVILCGGKGTRISEETVKIPKPMVKIGKIPILEHIMNYYSHFGNNYFILALGYKQQNIIEYFNKDKFKKKWEIEFVDTGLETLTGTRLKRLKKYFIENENFHFTYGDGLSNVNLKKLKDFHKKSKKICSVTAVRPTSRFGELILKKNKVLKFEEKPQVSKNWINGGFFVLNYKVFDYLVKKNHMFEREAITKLCQKNQISAFKHYDKWHCMDTMRDKLILNNFLTKRKAFWILK
jgi:glucose-1-phosphate cytidylyltransferase|tara:strand:- start:16751 stop:17461 length:711 start_codon:yes stop_codon:yes gene_type:complete